MTTAFGPQGEQNSPTRPQEEQAQPQQGEQREGAGQGRDTEKHTAAKDSKRRELIAKSRARVGHTVERMGHALQRPAERVGKALQRPLVGASVAGGLVAAAAGLWGATEAALGAFVGVIAYRRLRRRWREKASREESRSQAPLPSGPTPAVPA